LSKPSSPRHKISSAIDIGEEGGIAEKGILRH